MLFDIAGSSDTIRNIGEKKLDFLENQRKPARIRFIGDAETFYEQDISEKEMNDIL